MNRTEHGTPVTDDMIIESKSVLQDAFEQDQIAPVAEMPKIEDEMLLPQDPNVAAELGLDAQGLDEIAGKYAQMMELANEDPIMQEIFSSHIDFRWNDFVRPTETPKGFFGKLKASLSNPAAKRQAMLDKIMDAYTEMVASGQVGVQGKAAERLADSKAGIKTRKPQAHSWTKKSTNKYK